MLAIAEAHSTATPPKVASATPKVTPATPNVVPATPNVIERLKQKSRHAWDLGFKVRYELLDGRAATWCEIAGNKVIFVDLAATASEQLDQLERAIEDYQSRKRASVSQHPVGHPS